MKKLDPILLVVSITAALYFVGKATPPLALALSSLGALASFVLVYLVFGWYEFTELENVPRRYRWLIRWLRSHL